MNAKRGYVPEDNRNFSEEAVNTMRKASRHISYLINEGYELKQASTFVGNHFVLSERQRLALMRSVATDRQLRERRLKEKTRIIGEEVWIDGFNTVITLEVMLSDSIIIDHCRSWVNLMKKCVEKYGADLIQVWDCENRRG